MPAKGSVEWQGDVPSDIGSPGEITRDYTYEFRFEDGPGSNLEQLIAGAEAARLLMARSHLPFDRRRFLEEVRARLSEISITLAKPEIDVGELRQDANKLGTVMHRIEWLADISVSLRAD